MLATLDTLVRDPEREENDVRRSILHRTENGTRPQSVTPIRVHSDSFTIHMHLVCTIGFLFPRRRACLRSQMMIPYARKIDTK